MTICTSSTTSRTLLTASPRPMLAWACSRIKASSSRISRPAVPTYSRSTASTWPPTRCSCRCRCLRPSDTSSARWSTSRAHNRPSRSSPPLVATIERVRCAVAAVLLLACLVSDAQQQPLIMPPTMASCTMTARASRPRRSCKPVTLVPSHSATPNQPKLLTD